MNVRVHFDALVAAHSIRQHILLKRDAPALESRVVDEVSLDPLAYSMGPNQEIIEEEFEQSEDVKSWEGGSTDFSFDDDSDESCFK